MFQESCLKDWGIYTQIGKQAFHFAQTKNPDLLSDVWIFLVGVAGFEPATSCSQSRNLTIIFIDNVH